MRILTVGLIGVFAVVGSSQEPTPPSPPGALFDIGGGQRMHLNCTGRGEPPVIFESGAGDFSVIWSLVQPEVSRFTRACSYDRAGYAWSDPGARPRTFGQMAFELRSLLQKANVGAPYVLVGQSFGGSLVRGYATRYSSDVAGMVLVDAIHEDGYVVYGGQAHHLRDEASGRSEPPPRIERDTEAVRQAEHLTPAPPTPLDAPLDRMPMAAQQAWTWAARQPVFRVVQPLEMEWSADESERIYRRRRNEPAMFGDIPLLVLARTEGGYREGMNIPARTLEERRRAQQADMARLSTNGAVRFATKSGHNIHLEDPGFTVDAIREVLDQVRKRR